jgi:23S rRNA (cytosine1962-C5)-methyltransferase
VEDALTFVLRELKRGRTYDAVVLDPPSYGHGPKGHVWKLTERLPELLGLCAQLTAGGLRALLLTCHTPGYTPRVLSDLVERTWDECRARPPAAEPLELRTADGRELPAGVVVRWAR